MGEPIKRATLSAVAKEYEARGNVGGARQEQQTEFNPGAVFFGVNISQTPIMPGDKIFPEWFVPRTIGYEVAYRRVIRNKLKIQVRPWNAATDPPQDTAMIRAITPAAPNHICKFEFVPSDYYLANVYFPDGTITDYVDFNGVGTDDEDDAFASIERFSSLSAADQSGGKYGVALCCRIETGGLSLEEVDDEIDAKFTAATKTKTIVSSVSASIDVSGYLLISTGGSSITYYGES